MPWIRPLLGTLLVLLGLLWIGQGLDILKGSGMSGHGRYALVGAVVILCGAWLVWGYVRPRLQPVRT